MRLLLFIADALIIFAIVLVAFELFRQGYEAGKTDKKTSKRKVVKKK